MINDQKKLLAAMKAQTRALKTEWKRVLKEIERNDRDGPAPRALYTEINRIERMMDQIERAAGKFPQGSYSPF